MLRCDTISQNDRIYGDNYADISTDNQLGTEGSSVVGKNDVIAALPGSEENTRVSETSGQGSETGASTTESEEGLTPQDIASAWNDLAGGNNLPNFAELTEDQRYALLEAYDADSLQSAVNVVAQEVLDESDVGVKRTVERPEGEVTPADTPAKPKRGTSENALMKKAHIDDAASVWDEYAQNGKRAGVPFHKLAASIKKQWLAEYAALSELDGGASEELVAELYNELSSDVGVKRSVRSDAVDRLAAAVEKWKGIVADYMADRLDPRALVTMFDSTPASMQVLGLPNLPVRGSVQHTLAAVDMHGLSEAQMGRLPGELADPVLVYASKTDKRPWSLNFVTRLKNADGLVIVALHPVQDKPGGKTHYVATVFGRAFADINNDVRKGGLVYQSTELEPETKKAFAEAQKKYGRSAIDREALIANGYNQTLPRYAHTCLRRRLRNSSVPSITALITSPGMRFLLRPMVEERRMLSVAPTQRRSSRFMTTASWAIPFQTEMSPVSFQYTYASDDFVPAPSACMILQYSGSPPSMSGTILQKAPGKRPLSTLLIAA